ncbi:MAG TPA: SDR family oxidoreductase [Nitrososphaeraceae archaeon]|nr:SDR family oxidoreductase [Nitrososphaeraceae archaeon]
MPSSPNNQRALVAVVTGSTGGIGLATSLALARNGYRTYATMRNLAKRDSVQSVVDKQHLPIRVVQLDVTDENSIKSAIQSILSETGRIDLLVNNAGYGLTGALEDIGIDEIKAQYETNLYGVIRVTQEVLPIMRKQGSGRIINISSGAGRFGFPGGSAYVSSKFALEGLSESMAYELEQFGIKTVLVEPGFVRTNFGDNMVIAQKAQDPNSPYSQMMQMMSSIRGKMLENASDADLVAEVVVEAATAKEPNLRYLAGKDVQQMVAAKKSMSDEEFQKMMKQGVMDT